MAQMKGASLPTPVDLSDEVTKDDQIHAIGGFSDVFIGTWSKKNGEKMKVAVKVLRYVKTDCDRMKAVHMRLHRESGLWCTLDHPNVLPFYGICRADTQFPWLVSPFCELGDVKLYIKDGQNVDRLYLACGIAEGLRYLHSSKNMVHGDISTNNVLVDDSGEPRLCDFGRSLIIDRRTGYTTTTPVMNHHFTAPELIVIDDDDDDESATVPEPDAALRTKMTDIYAFAMVVIDVVSGALPFNGVPAFTTLIRVMKGRRPHRKNHQHAAMTEDVWKLVEDCWAQLPEDRLTIDKVCNRVAQIRAPPQA